MNAKKILVTSTKWKDIGGGRGYGNVTSKITKYICNGVNDTRKLFNISGASVQYPGRFSEKHFSWGISG